MIRGAQTAIPLKSARRDAAHGVAVTFQKRVHLLPEPGSYDARLLWAAPQVTYAVGCVQVHERQDFFAEPGSVALGKIQLIKRGVRPAVLRIPNALEREFSRASKKIAYPAPLQPNQIAGVVHDLLATGRPRSNAPVVSAVPESQPMNTTVHVRGNGIHGLEGPRRQLVIAVEKDDPFSFGGYRARVASGVVPLVRRVPQYGEPWIANARGDAVTVVGGSVIDHDHFEIGVILSEATLYCA